jgi:hypothetical protein
MFDGLGVRFFVAFADAVVELLAIKARKRSVADTTERLQPLLDPSAAAHFAAELEEEFVLQVGHGWNFLHRTIPIRIAKYIAQL